MMCVRASLALLVSVAAFLGLPATTRAEPPRVALVIGNASYAALPPLPGCLLSSHSVAAALRGLGFQVVERDDASSGATDAAISEFARLLTGAPGALGFVYACAYATSFNDRAFLLPVSARLARPTDALTQGVLARSLLDVLTRGGAGPSIVALDLVPSEPDAALHLDALAQASLPDTLGVVAATQARPVEAPTPLATALVAALKAPTVQTASVLTALPPGGGATIAVLHPATSGVYLAGAPPPPPAAPAPPPPPPVATPPAPTVSLPADEQMTAEDRRRVQTALARLGYYDGRVDGTFGPESRAAIRRYQHELGVEMTGRLTAAQATRLVAGP